MSSIFKQNANYEDAREFNPQYNYQRKQQQRSSFNYEDQPYFNNQQQNFNNKQQFEQELNPLDFSKEVLPQFERIFYNKDLLQQEDFQQVENHLKENQIKIISATNIPPPPFLSWKNSPLCDQLKSLVQSQGFEKPTSIQSQCIPIILNGSDLIGIAQTGSGKTLSYLLPMLIHINQKEKRERKNPVGLILVPTRELANQVQLECAKFGKAYKAYSTAIYGGASRSVQEQHLQKKPEIVVATPGRLIDFVQSKAVDLRTITYLVLDEADRMLDMGFEPQIRKILGQIRPDKQMIMFSATWPKEIKNLAYEFCQEKPVHVQIGENDLNVNTDIQQQFELIDQNQKLQRLQEIIQEKADNKTLIFTSTKRSCDFLEMTLKSQKISCLSLHGDKSQSQRDYIMYKFRSGQVQILLATDVASRGLDVKDVKLVINYDLPQNIEDYVHRIGRTGRAGAQGQSISFFDKQNDMMIGKKIIQLLKQHHIQPSSEFEQIIKQGYQFFKYIYQFYLIQIN
ncbi:hypothetical protein IMG5_122040 [Ichthyophthirius multifiliis]|uniref:RNA helicase n=1 Tax=Ichthyophthirius multifiliis TaxID=5932 RepID=G0QV89_ICHMU|nr:hypothetical protein IMG5_122040 [Ichthyophthirius multifiliis]EGR30873.1 hypothetical protein IMG5_122040 [Ichthyophthirius multifiliis]|eukprot:XP_004032460.1 hypothetical protein IMG5_122040 [Ichthyophthirius multifiliis]